MIGTLDGRTPGYSPSLDPKNPEQPEELEDPEESMVGAISAPLLVPPNLFHQLVRRQST